MKILLKKPLKIDWMGYNLDKLPLSHACYNRIDMPKYKTKKDMKEKLTIAILYGDGFYNI